MTFVEAVRTCLSSYATFGGRAPRSEFWYFVLFGWVTQLIASMIDAILFGSEDMGGPLALVASLGLLLPTLAVGVRRLHDIGRTGWWLLIGLVPLIGLLVLLYFYVQRSEPGSNVHGTDPTAGDAPAA